MVLVPLQYASRTLSHLLFGLEPRERTRGLGFSLSIYTPDQEAKRGPRRAAPESSSNLHLKISAPPRARAADETAAR